MRVIRNRRLFSASALLLMMSLMLSAPWVFAQDGQEQNGMPPEVQQNQDQWPLPNKDYANTREATGEIDSGNVGQLSEAWRYEILGSGLFGAATSNPIVQDGVVYFQDTESNIAALDLDSGEVIWEQEYGNSVFGPNGIAVGYDKVFAAASIYEMVALDKDTGEEVWSAELEGPTGSFQPTIYDGTLYASDVAAGLPEDPSAGAAGIRFYEAGSAGVIYAMDQETGDIQWQFSTVEEDFWGNPDVNSGGGVWYAPAIDTENGITYFGTGNPAPFAGIIDHPNGTSHPGDNPYANSLIALDHESGELQWWHSPNPEDIFDLDNQAPPILATTEVDDEERDIVITSGKHGYVLALDRETQEVLWTRAVGQHLNDDLTEIPEDTVIPVLPGTLGGIETPPAYADGIVYVPVVNNVSYHHPTGFDAETSAEAYDNAINRGQPTEEGTGELVAIDVNTGVALWRAEQPSVNLGAATVVNDLVFTATYDGTIYAYERFTGEEVWSTEAPAGINGWPVIMEDTIIWPAGVGEDPVVVAYRLDGDGAPDPTPTPDNQPTATPTPETDTTPAPATPTPEATPAPSPTPGSTPSSTPNPNGGQQEEVTIEVTAQNIDFNTDTITVPAGAQVTIEFTNEDTVGHNIAVYETDAAQESIFVGEIFSGPDTRTYEFTAPSEPGEYHFQCDPHPFSMFGDFIVEEAQ
ncbi:MAG: PQQ-binding-like beta-propeller repeat protein [Dehalococcoidia bacterium]